MANRETNVVNAYETTLSVALGVSDTTINVTSTAGTPAVPFYVVIDPDKDSKREVVLVDGSKTATTLVVSGASSRGVDGTSAVTHDINAKVGIYPVAGLWTDINDRVDAASDHGGLTGLADDDHTQYALADGSRGSFATTAQGDLADSAVQPGDTIPIADGGTGATTAAAARTNLVTAHADPAGLKITVSATEPGSPTAGDLWVDIT